MVGQYTQAQLHALAGVKLRLDAAGPQIQSQRAQLTRINERIREMQAERDAIDEGVDEEGSAQRASLTRRIEEAFARRAEVERMLADNLHFVEWAKSVLEP